MNLSGNAAYRNTGQSAWTSLLIVPTGGLSALPALERFKAEQDLTLPPGS